MSKSAKAAAKLRRSSFKRARKDARQKQYESWTAAGQNKKSKRNRLNSKRANGLTTRKHADSYCGSIGCQKCWPAYNTATYAQPGSCFYGRKFEAKPKPWTTSKQKLTFMVRKALTKGY